MFTELMPLLHKRRLLLTISLVEGDTIRATVVPQKASDTDEMFVFISRRKDQICPQERTVDR